MKYRPKGLWNGCNKKLKNHFHSANVLVQRKQRANMFHKRSHHINRTFPGDPQIAKTFHSRPKEDFLDLIAYTSTKLIKNPLSSNVVCNRNVLLSKQFIIKYYNIL